MLKYSKFSQEYLDVSSATAAWSQKDQILHEIDLLVANAQFTHGEEEEDKKEDQTEKTYARVLYRGCLAFKIKII